MSKVIRGNRVSPLWFLLGGIVLIITGLLLVLAGFGGASAAFEGEVDPQNVGLLIVIGGTCLTLGVLSLLIWLVAFAVSVALVETNRRLAQLNVDVGDLRDSARQQAYAPTAAPGLLDWRPGEDS